MNTRRTIRIAPLLALLAGFALSGTAFAQHGGGGSHGGGGGHAAVGHAAAGRGAGGHYYGGGYRAGYGGYRGGYYGGYRGGYYGGYRGGWRGGYYGWGLGLGLFAATLPWYYSTYWWGGIPYYYADNSYYIWNGDVGQYETVAPPEGLTTQGGAAAPPGGQAPAAQSDLFMYPKAGQTAEQQDRDRYECHRWAADQSGFDPTQAPAPGSQDAAMKRDGYMRAEAACLEARNYSVR